MTMSEKEQQAFARRYRRWLRLRRIVVGCERAIAVLVGGFLAAWDSRASEFDKDEWAIIVAIDSERARELGESIAARN